LVAGNPVRAIYAEGDLPPEFATDAEFNAAQAQQVKDLGADALTDKKEALPSAEERKNARPVFNFNTLSVPIIYTLCASWVRRCVSVPVCPKNPSAQGNSSKKR
jgi:hypothetical protein